LRETNFAKLFGRLEHRDPGTGSSKGDSGRQATNASAYNTDVKIDTLQTAKN
jgi:hypothetical protein